MHGNFGLALAVDAKLQGYVTGGTHAEHFKTTPGSFQPVRVSTFYQAFVTKYDAPGQIVYSTLLGADNDTYGSAIGVNGPEP